MWGTSESNKYGTRNLARGQRCGVTLTGTLRHIHTAVVLCRCFIVGVVVDFKIPVNVVVTNLGNIKDNA